MKKKKFICTRGLSFSGKSTFAQKFMHENPDTVWIEKDMIRRAMGADLIKGIRVKESKVIEKRNEEIMKALEKGQNIINSDTNLNDKANHIANMKALVYPKYREIYDFEVIDFTDVPFDVILERAKNTNRPEGAEYWVRVVNEQKNKFMRPVQIYEDPNYYNSDLPLAVIFDLDNTLTFKGDRSPYAADCSGDTPNVPVVEICKMYCNRPDITVICLSGRKEEARQSTETWLAAHGIKYDILYMRAQDDNKRDSVTKRDIFENKIEGKYLIHLVCDDRFQVCDELWRDKGLPLLQFGNSNF